MGYRSKGGTPAGRLSRVSSPEALFPGDHYFFGVIRTARTVLFSKSKALQAIWPLSLIAVAAISQRLFDESINVT